VKEVLDLVVRKSTEAVNAKGALLRTLNLETNEFELSAAYGLSQQYLAKGHISSRKAMMDFYRMNKVLVINDVLTDPRVQYRQEAWEEGIRMMLDLPLSIGDHVVGIIRIYFTENRELSREELNFVVSIAEQSALAIEKARLIESQKSRYDHLATRTEKLSALGRMAAGIAHEINNPLAGILLYSTNLSKKVPKDGPLKEGLDIVIHETIRCKSIIQELLEFSREREPEKTLSNINSVIEKALSILENEFRLHYIDLDKDLSSQMPDALLDVNQIEQVLVNLLLNAIESIEEHGRITIRSRLTADERCLEVQITDTGCGISSEDMNRVFDPFFSTKIKGTGLGLAVSYGIIQNHQGNILVSSEPGEGSTFTIAIPFRPAASSAKKEGLEDGTP
jgi:signal transduction histidine kinase